MRKGLSGSVHRRPAKKSVCRFRSANTITEIRFSGLPCAIKTMRPTLTSPHRIMFHIRSLIPRYWNTEVFTRASKGHFHNKKVRRWKTADFFIGSSTVLPGLLLDDSDIIVEVYAFSDCTGLLFFLMCLTLTPHNAGSV